MVVQQRLYGCAIGAVIGDALGMPLEFGPPSPEGQFVRQMRAGRLPAGSFTDDTEMAVALAESLADQRPLDPVDLTKRFVAWRETNPPDIGIHTRSILGRIAQGESWREVEDQFLKTGSDNAGNGSVMRCWPVAVAWRDHQEELIQDSQLQSRVTHAPPDCLAASVFTNLAISQFIEGNSIDSGLAYALSHTPALSKDFKAVINSAPRRSRSELKNSGWVRHTIESAVWALLNFNSFAETVIQVVNLGNDADTAGTVVGAMAGAYYGLQSIPNDWLNELQGQWPVGSTSTWSAKEICSLVDQLI